MNRLSPNELNNLVFLLIKHGYGHFVASAKVPSPDLIKLVLLETVDHGGAIPEVIRCTMFIMETKRNVCLTKGDFERVHTYLHKVAVAFMKQSEHVRNSIADMEEFATLH